MSSSISGFSGFNSGLPIDDIVTKLINAEKTPITLMKQRQQKLEQQKGLYNTTKDKVKDLFTAIRKVTKREVDGTTLFDKKIGTSSNEEVVTASVTGTAASQSLELEIKALPSPTRATSTTGVGSFSTATTLDQLGITAGNFKVYSNGVPYTITVATTDTVGSVLSAINTAIPDTEVSTDPTIVDGKITLSYLGTPNINFGTAGDTSNFLSVTHLLTGIDNGSGTLTASQRNTAIKRNELLSSTAANMDTPVTDGTFSINGVSFDTTGKSMNDIVDLINSTTAANVTASFNSGNNTFQLTSKATGSGFINLANGTGNFLTAMKLVSGTNTTTSQAKGRNTEFVLNGTTMFSTTTSVDETITGLTGVTLDIKQAKVGTTIQLSVKSDTASMKDAIQAVVDKYNNAIQYIDQQTDSEKGGPLAGEGRLKGLRSQLRSMFSEQVAGLSGSAYDSLQQIGITTGAVGSTAGKASVTLQFEPTKFLDALTADSNKVKKLFLAQDLGGTLNATAADDGFNGAFKSIENYLSDSLYVDASGNNAYGALYLGTGENDRGLFATFKGSAEQRIKDLNDSISRKEDQLSKREATIRKQFIAMDRLVGQYQSQGTAITNLSKRLSSNN